jgi:hypothetical protein
MMWRLVAENFENRFVHFVLDFLINFRALTNPRPLWACMACYGSALPFSVIFSCKDFEDLCPASVLILLRVNGLLPAVWS